MRRSEGDNELESPRSTASRISVAGSSERLCPGPGQALLVSAAGASSGFYLCLHLS